MNVIKTAHGRGRSGELVEEWTICALKGDKKSVAAAMPEFKEACLSIMGKSPGKPYLPAYVTCGFAEFITKIAGCVKPPSIEIKNRAAPSSRRAGLSFFTLRARQPPGRRRSRQLSPIAPTRPRGNP